MSYVYVPARGKRWAPGTLLLGAADDVLYRVVGGTFSVAGDLPLAQRVVKAGRPPWFYVDAVRLFAIAAHVDARGTHAPSSRGASIAAATAPIPEHDPARAVRYDLRRERGSLATPPELTVVDDILILWRPIMDDAPIVVWLRDSALAEEARTLIARRPDLTLWPRVSVFGGGQ